MDGVLLQTVEALGDSPFLACAGETWEQLQAEKEEVQREILSVGPLLQDNSGGLQECEPSESCLREMAWQHRATLEKRLRDLNDAQDRLIDGGYGLCLECRGQIDTERLAADSAASLCIKCQTLRETESFDRIL